MKAGRLPRTLIRGPRAIEAALVALTVVAVLAAKEPAAGAGYRWLLAAACIAATAVLALGAGSLTSKRRVLVLAVALRFAAFPLGPTLSDDAYRYAWDGRVQLEGYNPYRFRPDAPELETLGDDPPYGRLNSPRYYSVYPPASQLAFAAGAAMGREWPAAYYAIKALIGLAELAGVLLLLRLAPAGLAALYALHPLAILEVAGQGHMEGLAVLGLLLAAWAVVRREGPLAGAGLALAAGAKLLPGLLLPFAWRRAGASTVAGFVLAGAMLTVPYAAPGILPNVLDSLNLYVRSFEFAAGPYLALKAAAAALGMGDVSKMLGPLLAGVFLLGFLALVLTDRPQRRSFAGAASSVYALFFVTATTIHPWYLVPALAMAPLLRRPWPWVWTAGFAPATYLFYTGPHWAYSSAVALAWGVAGVLALGGLSETMLRRRGAWKWAWIESHIGPVAAGTTVLDLGAAEGFVGEAAGRPWAGSGSAQVTLADVTDANQTTLPHLVFDGERLPMADGSFDVVLLVFVLHHARDPAGLLREASRVAREGVVVMESVPEGRLRVLTEVLDRNANRLRTVSLRDQEPWLRMRPAPDWREMIDAAGLEVIAEDRRGRFIHPQVLLIARPARASSSDTPNAGGTT